MFECSFDAGVMCVGCGAERDWPDDVDRALLADELYATTREPCDVCGDCKVTVSVSVSLG